MVGRNGDRFSRVLISSRKHQTNPERRRKGGTEGCWTSRETALGQAQARGKCAPSFKIERNPFDLLSSIKRVVTKVVTECVVLHSVSRWLIVLQIQCIALEMNMLCLRHETCVHIRKRPWFYYGSEGYRFNSYWVRHLESSRTSMNKA